MDVVRETPGVARTAFSFGPSPAGCISIRVATTLSDMSDRLSVLSSCSMSGVLFIVRG
jgi:hypothetical protein